MARRLSLEDRVEFRGFIERDALVDLYRRARIFVLPSRYEGQSTALLEAMACRDAVIVSSIDSNREVVTHGETGWLFEAGSVSELSTAMITLLSDPILTRDLGRKAREAVSRDFRWEHVCERFQRVLMPLVR